MNALLKMIALKERVGSQEEIVALIQIAICQAIVSLENVNFDG